VGILGERITTRQVLGLSWRSLLGLSGFKDHVGSTQGLQRLLDKELGYRTFNETAIPLHLVRADLITGGESSFRREILGRRFLQARSFPASFRP
jgi:hypothetical protein